MNRFPLRARTRTTALLLQNLEPRTLLSAVAGPVDLTPTSASSIKLASAIVTGTAVKGSLKVAISNLGTGTSAKGATVSAFLRPASGADINITAKPAAIPALAGGKAKPVNLPLAVPTTLPAGSYTLVLTITNPGDANTANDSLVVPFTLDATAGHVTLGGSLGGVPSTIDATGKNKTSFNLDLSDSGNLPASGSATVTIKLHPTSGATSPSSPKASTSPN